MGKIISIFGPTGLGKSSLAIELAKKINGEIIGVDSRQVYKGIPIGTAQPNSSQLNEVPHHLIGFKNLNEKISAGEYMKLIDKKIDQILLKNKSAILCGGTGLYFKTLKEGIFEGSHTNEEIRTRLEKEYDDDKQAIFEKLQKIDSNYSKIVHINNKKRLVRALEIYQITGETPSKNFKNQYKEKTNKLNLFTVFLTIEKEPHINNIKKRTIKMLDSGWIDEVKTLINLKNEMDLDFPALDSIGYKQMIDYLNGSINKDALIETVVSKTWQYAKKQNKWFKKENIDLTVDMTNLDTIRISNCIYDIYKSFN